MKIGYQSPSWPSNLQPNGIVKYLDIMEKELSAQGHDCFIFTDNIYGKDTYSNVIDFSKADHCFHEKGLYGIIKKIRRKIGFETSAEKFYPVMKSLTCCIQEIENKNNRGFDIFEMEESFGAVKYLLENISTPVVIKLHGPWFLNGEVLGVLKDNAFYDRVKAEGEAITAAAGVTAPSENVLNEVRKYYGVELPDAKVIHNPVEVVNDKWSYKECIKNQILFVGRFDKHKGGDIVIKAFNLIAKKNKLATLIFVGPDRGINIEGKKISIEDYINEEINDKDIRKRIQYYGQIASEEVDSLRNKSHITVMASRWENFANTVIEALAKGCPVIGTNSGGTPEIIKNNKTGLLVEVANPVELSEKISLLLADSELAIELGKNAAIDVENRFNPHKIVNETLDYYISVINKIYNN